MFEQKQKQTALLENVDFTPTQIATQLSEQTRTKVSNRQVNRLLQKLGLQTRIKSGNGRDQWCLTEQGKKYGRVYQVSSAHSDWSGNQIKWSEEVIDLLQQISCGLTASRSAI